MSLPLPVAGLDHILGPLADGHVVALEGGGDAAASFLAARIARESADAGRHVDVVTTRPRWHPEAAVGRAWSDLPVGPDGDLIVDSFSVLAADASVKELAQWLMALSLRVSETGGVAVLVLEEGILDPRRVATLRHFVDGWLGFQVQTDGVDVQRMLRVPRWLDGAGRDAGIFYQFDGTRLVVDTRRRHV